MLSALGAGGMGEVYKARDTRLDRAVALKVIQPAVSASAEMRERFEREARAISALDHPHICMLYDVCREADVSFLVMQYLEGETLADRLARAGRPASDPTRPSTGSQGEVSVATISRGPIPFETALKYAAEIAQALDAAHRRGIVHRDLKPGNVMLTKTGTKLLDFGLAKLTGSGARGFDDGVTRTTPLTGQGAILGTLHYMSPEQLEGRDVDARSDIHAFGAVFFEMLSGRRAFEGQSQAGIIAAIIGSDPPKLTSLIDSKVTLPHTAQRALDRLLARCLAKNPDDRWQSAADLSAELQWIGEERHRQISELSAGPAANPGSRIRERIWIGVAAAALIALAGVAYTWYPRPAAPPRPVALTIGAPDGKTLPATPNFFAISPDGSRVAFTTGTDDDTELWIRELGSVAPVKVAGVTDAFQLTWSPDSKSILYASRSTSNRSGRSIRRFDLAGGPVRTINEEANSRPTWGRSGVIITEGPDNTLYRVAETGGSLVPVLAPDTTRGELDLRWPSFLPDGRHFLFMVRAKDPAITGIYLGALDSAERTRLVDVMSSVDYAAGYLFYQREGTLMALPFDVATRRLTGPAIPLVDNVRYNALTGRGAFSVSDSGALVYLMGEAIANRGERRVTIVDKSGNDIRDIGPSGPYATARFSPNGLRAVVSEEDFTTSIISLHLLEFERSFFSRFTAGPDDERSAIWTVDGAGIVFHSNRPNAAGIYRRGAGGGSTDDELLLADTVALAPTGFSSDGKRLLFTKGSGPDQRIWILPIDEPPQTRKPVQAFPGVSVAQLQARFSPDDKWIVYAEGSIPPQSKIYIQPYPPDGRREQISPGGGLHPIWLKDGRHILYRANGGPVSGVMSVELAAGNKPLPPVELFKKSIAGPINRGFDVDEKNDRFLFVLPPATPAASATPAAAILTVIVNFAANIGR